MRARATALCRGLYEPHLLRSPFFWTVEAIDAPAVKQLCLAAEDTTVTPGKEYFSLDVPADKAYVICWGSLHYTRGGRRRTARRIRRA